jgi:hypothetical protein
MPSPRDLVEKLERSHRLPDGSEERFSGYGVMALPFVSGDILCLRRFPASSVGPGYISLWHRDPDERWTMYQDVQPEQACPRYFGNAVARSLVADVQIDWTGPETFTVTMEGERGLEWHVSLSSTSATSVLNSMGRLLPDALWRSPSVLKVMGVVARTLLRAGNLGLAGRAPNGQSFVANPRLMWLIKSSRAVLNGRDLGAIGPVPVQARLGDFWIAQRGIFVIGRAFFEPFDEAKHVSATSGAATS